MSDDNLGKSYSDDELKDIMDEIENLEKEFLEDDTQEEADTHEEAVAKEPEPKSEPKPEPKPEPEHIVEEVVESKVDALDSVMGTDEEEKPVEKVVSKEPVSIQPVKNKKESTTMESNPKTELKCHGDMELELSFDIKGHVAKLSIENGGCHLSLKGLNLVIDKDKGCVVEMPGGVKFEVPFEESTNSNVKKAG